MRAAAPAPELRRLPLHDLEADVDDPLRHGLAAAARQDHLAGDAADGGAVDVHDGERRHRGPEPLFGERREIRDGRMLAPTRPGLTLGDQARAWTRESVTITA